MATITSLGIGSGIDINSIVNQLVALERRPLQLMKNDATRLQTQVSSFGRMQSLYSGLQSASNALNDAKLWTRSAATSSDATAVSSTGGNDAAAGNYAVTVQALASSQTVASGSNFAAATALVGSGTLTFQLGSWNADQTGFTDKPDSAAVTVDVTATDTLQSLRDKINASSAGVTASIVSDASGVRLSLRSASTGAENGFRINAAESAAPGLARLAYDPLSGPGEMTLTQSAGNARAVINGIAVVSASNELSGVIEGLTLRLRKETATPVDIAVTSDRTAVSAAVKAFTDAYNDLTRYLGEQTRFDAATQTGGPLQGDSAVTSLQSRLRGPLNASSGASTAFARLSDAGLELQRDGTLKINQTKLDGAMDKLAELQKAFTNTDIANPANAGFTRRFAELATQVLASEGSLSTRTAGLKKLIDKNSDNQTRLNDRVERFQQRLVQQYTAMDANVARLNALQSYVSQQIAALNRPVS